MERFQLGPNNKTWLISHIQAMFYEPSYSQTTCQIKLTRGGEENKLKPTEHRCTQISFEKYSTPKTHTGAEKMR